MNGYIILAAAIAGYLIGSFSNARLITRIFAPGKDISRTQVHIDGTEKAFDLRVVSATTVSINLGARYGFITMLLDMLKIILPILAVKHFFPEHPYFLITAAAGMVGHIWPIYYRFKGGRGILAVYGTMFAIDWIGAIVTSVAGMIFGLAVLRNVVAAYIVGVVFIIPWLWFRTHDIAYVIYAVIINLIMAVAVSPEIKEMNRLKKEDGWDDPIVVFQMTGMGRGIVKMAKLIGVIKPKPKQDPEV